MPRCAVCCRSVSLFAIDTKTAIENCKEKACCLTCPLPSEEMCEKILPNPNSTCQLTEFLSLRGESKLEAFHGRFAHFANCGTRNSLADNLNLAGTSRCNLSIRHKRSLACKNPVKNTVSKANPNRKKTPAGWEKAVPFHNHSELWHVNKMAAAVGCVHPFPMAEVLPQDNGERFFSEHMTAIMPELKGTKHGEFGECLCRLCSNPTESVVMVSPATTTTMTSPATTTTPTGMIVNQPTRTHNNVNSNISSRQQARRPDIWRTTNRPNAANVMAGAILCTLHSCCTTGAIDANAVPNSVLSQLHPTTNCAML